MNSEQKLKQLELNLEILKISKEIAGTNRKGKILEVYKELRSELPS